MKTCIIDTSMVSAAVAKVRNGLLVSTLICFHPMLSPQRVAELRLCAEFVGLDFDDAKEAHKINLQRRASVSGQHIIEEQRENELSKPGMLAHERHLPTIAHVGTHDISSNFHLERADLSSRADFIPSPMFTVSMEGFNFRQGMHGPGYYRDVYFDIGVENFEENEIESRVTSSAHSLPKTPAEEILSDPNRFDVYFLGVQACLKFDKDSVAEALTKYFPRSLILKHSTRYSNTSRPAISSQCRKAAGCGARK